jgi:hypothetical protein
MQLPAVIMPPVMAVIVQVVPVAVIPDNPPVANPPCAFTVPPITRLSVSFPVLFTVIAPLKSVVGVRINPPVVVVVKS